MKALTVKQPWASMIALGEKTQEFRSWPTMHRGQLLICSAARPVVTFPDDDEDLPGITLPAGYALAVVDLVKCRPDLEHGFSWELQDPREIIPFRVKGKQRLFEIDTTGIERLPAEIEHHLMVDYSSL